MLSVSNCQGLASPCLPEGRCTEEQSLSVGLLYNMQLIRLRAAGTEAELVCYTSHLVQIYG